MTKDRWLRDFDGFHPVAGDGKKVVQLASRWSRPAATTSVSRRSGLSQATPEHKFGMSEMADNETNAPAGVSKLDPHVSSATGHEHGRGVEPGDHPDLVLSLKDLTAAIRDLVARSPVSSEELLTAEQLAELFRMSPRTLRDLAASGHIPHHRIGKHYRFSRDDIAEILQLTRQTLRSRRCRPRAA